MRRTTRTTRTRAKLDTRNPRHNKSACSSSEHEMTSLGLFASSSSSSSSNLSPLAIPFTVNRSNSTKFNLDSNIDPHFNFQSSTSTQGLLADSIRTATFPNPNPNNITTPTTHNRSSMPAANLSAIGPNQRVIDAPFSTFSSPFVTSSTVNWSPISSMNSSVKSGLEPINSPIGHSYNLNPNTQPRNWSFGSDDSDDDAPMMPLSFNLFGPSQGSYTQSLSGSKYNVQAYGSQGKEDSSMFGGVFGHPVSRENSIGSSVIGSSHGASSSSTSHGVVSSGVSNEGTFTWNGRTSSPYPFETRSVYDYSSSAHIVGSSHGASSSSTSHGVVSSGISNEGTFTWNGRTTSPYPFETRSVYHYSSSDHISPSLTTKSLDVNSTSLFNNNNLSVSHNPLKESLNPQVSDMNSTEEVNPAAHLSENLDCHNPGEDSPCWKGAPSRFSSSGSQEDESSQNTMKKLQKNNSEDVLLPMDQTLHGALENAANVVTSESLDVNMVVKALNNHSALLLRLYLKDELVLKEQDQKALDHVIANLNVCMSSQFQQVDPAQKCSSHKHITSNVFREERNNDQFGKNIEELQSAYIRDEGLPKDYNMVQKIKRVLDENLECNEDLPSDPLLFKNLWLEAEAELCVSSYRSRLRSAKREIGKSKALDVSEDASDIKKVSSSNYSRTESELSHEAAGRNTSKTHTHNLSLPNVDGIENSVMDRFNILKRREESNPINVAEKEPAGVEASCNKIQSSGVAKEPHLQHLLDTDDAVVVVHCQGNQKMHNPLVTEDVDHAVMARLNILKSRGELDRVNAEQGVSRDAGHAKASDDAVVVHSQGNQTMHNSLVTEDVDHAVMARLNILKSRGELDRVNTEQGVSRDAGHAKASEEGVSTGVMQNQFGPFTASNASSFGWEYVTKGWV